MQTHVVFCAELLGFFILGIGCVCSSSSDVVGANFFGIVILPCWTAQMGSICCARRELCVLPHQDDEVLTHLYLFLLFGANMLCVVICTAGLTALTSFEGLR